MFIITQLFLTTTCNSVSTARGWNKQIIHSYRYNFMETSRTNAQCKRNDRYNLSYEIEWILSVLWIFFVRQTRQIRQIRRYGNQTLGNVGGARFKIYDNKKATEKMRRQRLFFLDHNHDGDDDGDNRKKKKKANSWLSSGTIGWNNHLRLKKATINWKCAAVGFVLGLKLEKNINNKSSQI